MAETSRPRSQRITSFQETNSIKLSETRMGYPGSGRLSLVGAKI